MLWKMDNNDKRKSLEIRGIIADQYVRGTRQMSDYFNEQQVKLSTLIKIKKIS